MSVLLDTSFVVALAYPDDQNASRAAELYEEILDGVHGSAFVTDYVVDESLTLAWVRSRRSSVVLQVADLLFGKEAVLPMAHLVFVGEAAFNEAKLLHRRHHARLSFTDCATLAVRNVQGISKVSTFEGGFGGFCEVLS